MRFTGKHYYSGDSDLPLISVGPSPTPTGGEPPIKLIARLPSEECGCPEETWRIDGLILLFHFEDDGSSEAFLYGGDWELETTIEARSLNDLRAKSFQWLADFLDAGKPE